MIRISSIKSNGLRPISVLSTPLRTAALFAMGLILVLSSARAIAKPEFAAKTGYPCGQCHMSQTGGGPLKPFGESFKANGYEVKKKK